VDWGIVWIGCAIGATILGAQKGNTLVGLVLGMLLGPLGLLLVALAKDNKRECPQCRERIHREANVCPHCRSPIKP